MLTGFVQRGFHCSCFTRNENLIVVGSALCYTINFQYITYYFCVIKWQTQQYVFLAWWKFYNIFLHWIVPKSNCKIITGLFHKQVHWLDFWIVSRFDFHRNKLLLCLNYKIKDTIFFFVIFPKINSFNFVTFPNIKFDFFVTKPNMLWNNYHSNLIFHFPIVRHCLALPTT